MAELDDRIQLRVSNHQAYVWEVQDIARLRVQHRVCGLLGGTLPHLAQQNVFLGVPLVLMPEEVVLLVEKGIATLVDDAGAHRQPTQAEKDAWNEAYRLEQAQSAALKGSDNANAHKTISEEAAMKRRQREEKRATQAGLAVFEGHPLTLSKNTQSSMLNQGTPSATRITTIPTSSTPLSWYNPSKNVFSTIAAAKQAGVWTFPESSAERARCGVFRTLWEKGYYLGCGIRFGGEFLVYPGDPLRYHSYYVASVLESRISPLRPMEIIAHGRLGTATKKAHLLCSWDEEAQQVEVHSIEWAGFG